MQFFRFVLNFFFFFIKVFEKLNVEIKNKNILIRGILFIKQKHYNNKM